MPTGYTYKVSDGTEPSFETFVLRCAKAFGACINQRDSNAEFPDITAAKPSTYYSDRMSESTQEIARLRAISDEDLFEEALTAYETEKLRIEMKIEEEKQQAARYENMLALVMAWTPPTAEHDSLKQFMIQQLTESQKFDSSLDSYYVRELAKLEKPLLENIEKYRLDRVYEEAEHYAYNERQFNEDVARNFERCQWIQDLFDSLNVDVVDDKVISRADLFS